MVLGQCKHSSTSPRLAHGPPSNLQPCLQKVPGTNGNVVTKCSLCSRALTSMGIVTAGATNVNQDHGSIFTWQEGIGVGENN
jgi:hypothetical protein